MEREERSDRFTEIGDRYASYEVYDPDGDKIGKVDDLFVDEYDNPQYVGVKTGLLGTKSTLIPWELVTVDDEASSMTVAADDEHVKNGPAFDDDEEITREFEQRVYSHFGLELATTAETPGAYGVYYADAEEEHTDLAAGERLQTGTAPPTGQATGATDEDELRVQRTEEELRAGTRKREAGTVNVRKRVRTDRKRMEVPTRREEVHVDRVPVDSETTGAEIGDDEISVPVTQEEVVVEKRPVAKEEIRIRKDVVEDTQVVEEDVRREEVDVDDQTAERDTR